MKLNEASLIEEQSCRSLGEASHSRERQVKGASSRKGKRGGRGTGWPFNKSIFIAKFKSEVNGMEQRRKGAEEKRSKELRAKVGRGGTRVSDSSRVLLLDEALYRGVWVPAVASTP